jgi:hypothetical protein
MDDPCVGVGDTLPGDRATAVWLLHRSVHDAEKRHARQACCRSRPRLGNPITSEESRRQSADPNDSGESLPLPLRPRSRPFYPLTRVASFTVARRNHTAVARLSKLSTVRSQCNVLVRRVNPCQRRPVIAAISDGSKSGQEAWPAPAPLLSPQRCEVPARGHDVGCRPDHPRRRRIVSRAPDGLIFRGDHRSPRAGSPDAPTRTFSHSKTPLVASYFDSVVMSR